MGYNTAVLVLNDGADLLASDPEAGRKIYEGILTAPRDRDRATYVSLGNHCNPVSVLPSHHADEVQIIAIGGNSIVPLAVLYHSWRDMSDPAALLKKLADQLGYRIVKKPTKA